MHQNSIALFSFVTILATHSLSEKVAYNDFTVYRTIPRSEKDVDFLKILQNNPMYDFWSSSFTVNDHIDIMVPPFLKDHFIRLTGKNYSIETKILIENVQELIDKENSELISEFNYNVYNNINEIDEKLNTIAEEYPNEVQVVEAGISYEERKIMGLYLQFVPKEQNRSIFIEANINAREWISTAVALNIIDNLLSYEESEDLEVLKTYNWYIFPVVNPDGFAYTISEDRLWRKTRKPYYPCIGANANLNWDYHYEESGVNDNSCSGNYRGPAAFSEDCTRTLSQFISKIGYELVGYISLQSYSQRLLFPYAHTDEPLDNHYELNSVAYKAVNSLAKEHGTKYEFGNIFKTKHELSGNSVDWVKSTFQPPITYTYELRDKGQFGYLLPQDQIKDTSEETFKSLVIILKEFNKILNV